MNEITQLLHIDPLLLQALREDIPEEDVSTNAVMPHACPGTVDLIAKEDGIVAGLAVYARVFTPVSYTHLRAHETCASRMPSSA